MAVKRADTVPHITHMPCCVSAPRRPFVDILPRSEHTQCHAEEAKHVVSEFISNNYVAINKQMTAIKLPTSEWGKLQVELCQVLPSTAGCMACAVCHMLQLQLHYSCNISHTYAL